jgi:hypothetical protein
LTSARVIASLAEGRAANNASIVVRGDLVSDRASCTVCGVNTVQTILRTSRASIGSVIKIEGRVTSGASDWIRAS